MNLQEGMVVADKFRLERMIGQGGMGSVWRAHHVGLDIPCAVKFIEGELAKLQEAQDRFKREAHAAAKLDSPHVVKIYDYGVWSGTPYIAMELLNGQDLGKLLSSSPGGRLGASEVNRIVQQVCKALTKAHAAGVVHRDLKPDNIFIVKDEDDSHGVVKILDFGVAKSTSNAIDGSNTKTGAMLGTPYYMSPEQAQGTKAVDGRSDLWSLAVIVFQCITGRLPFESEALGDLLVKIIVQPIPVPSSLGVVPPNFDRWWLSVADRNPENRPPNARAFAESLMLALGQSSVTEVGMDRAKLMKLGGATAVMNQPMMNTPPNLGHNVPNTPFPSAQANTPNPYVQHQTPQGQMQPPGGPLAQSGATFSGVEPPAMVPKKGLPVPVMAAAAALLFVGLGLIGFVALKGNKQAHAGGGEPTASASAAPTDTVAAKPTSEPATPPPPASVATAASATPPTEPGAAPAVTTVAAGGAHHTTTTTTHTNTVGGTKPPASASAAVAVKPPTAPPTASAKKPELGLGF